MELNRNNSHKKMDLDNILLRFKVGAFGILAGLNMALFSGAGVLPPLQAYAAEDTIKGDSELTDAERMEPANLPDYVSHTVLYRVNEEREQDGLPRLKSVEEITRGDLEKYLKILDITILDDVDLDWVNDCKNIQELRINVRDDRDCRAFDSVDFSKFTDLETLNIYRLYSGDFPDYEPVEGILFDEANYGFILEMPSLKNLTYKHDEYDVYADPKFLYDLSNMPNMEDMTCTVDIESIDYTKIGTEGNLKELTLVGDASTVAISLRPEEKEDLIRRGINLNIINRKNNREEISERVDEVNRKLDLYVSEINLREDMTEAEKRNAILVYVIDLLEYDSEVAEQLRDENYVETDQDKTEKHQKFYKDGYLYGAIEGDSQICGNYAGLFQAFAERSGLESYILVSRTHAYNLVKVGNKYVVVDPTSVDATRISYTINRTENVDKGDGTVETVTESTRYEGPSEIIQNFPEMAEENIKYMGMDMKDIPSDDTSYQTLNLPEGIQLYRLDGDDKKPMIEGIFEIIVDNKWVFIIGGAALMGILGAIKTIQAINRSKAASRMRFYPDDGYYGNYESSSYNDRYSDSRRRRNDRYNSRRNNRNRPGSQLDENDFGEW